MKRRGIQLNDNNDLGIVMDIKVNPVRDQSGKIISGIVVGDILEQNKALILIAHPGELKFNPDVGVGIEDLLLSGDYLEYRHKIREHFTKDGLRISRLDLNEKKPTVIIADYAD